MIKLACVNLFCLLLLTACGGGGSTPPAKPNTPPDSGSRGELVSGTDKSSYSQQQIETQANGYLATIYNGASTVRLVYKTQDSHGLIINVSGLLAIPLKQAAADSPIMVYHHPTIYHDAHAPSNFASNDLFAALLASQGYIVLMPDYIGYGASAALLHPYLHAASLATTTVDMLRAAKTYLQQAGIGVQAKLFLTGYSEGGYATLAAHRLIESTYANEFTVTASVPGAGPYDITGTLNDYLINGSLVNLAGLMFAFAAYDSVYDMNRLAEFFQSPYDKLAATAFYGDKYENDILAQLSGVTSITDLFTNTFLTDYQSANGEARLKARLAENDIYDWKPRAPIRFYHSSYDTVVPPQNTATAVAAMQARAVNNDVDVALIDTCSITQNAHNACVQAYITYMLEYFGSLQ